MIKIDLQASISSQAAVLRAAIASSDRDPYRVIEEMVVTVLEHPWVDAELQERLIVAMVETVDVDIEIEGRDYTL